MQEIFTSVTTVDINGRVEERTFDPLLFIYLLKSK